MEIRFLWDNKIWNDFKPDNEFTKSNQDAFGMAFDIGTTTVVGNLWNLKNGENLGSYAMTNPQVRYGGNVISRISYAGDSNENRKELHRVIIKCLNSITEELTNNNGITADDIVRTVAVGNTTMSHLFADKNIQSLTATPFHPAYEGPLSGMLHELGLKGKEEGTYYLVPGIAGHVGSDITSGIVATSLKDKKETILFIDIGTNGEIVLSSNGRMITCSTAAGPAFEGACVAQGMRAAEGAIEKVSIVNDEVELVVIGDSKPIGICGSGIIDTVAQMKEAGLIDETGKLYQKDEYESIYNKNGLSLRLTEDGNVKFFRLTQNGEKDEVYINQKDIREVQLAKAAISAGIHLLLIEMGLSPDDIDAVVIAGAFGSHIDCANAKKIGIIPDISDDKIHFAGNTAGIGASMILLSDSKKKDGEDIVNDIAHLELAECSDFQSIYLREMNL